MKCELRDIKACLRRLATVVAASVMLSVSVSVGAAAIPAPPQTTDRYDGDESERIEVTVKDGYIYVTSPRAVTLSLYSILGQLIARESVQAGTTRIKAPARGVYILKAGSATRRVTVN